jgi:hypothetical protein
MMKTEEATVTYTFDEAIVSDLHKDAFGFRPSEGFWFNWNFASDDAKQTVWDGLIYALNRAMDEQKAAYDAAKSEYEARLAEYISIGAKDRATAIRWLVQSLELTETDKWYGAEYICYTLGLPNQMKSEFEGVI